MKDTPRDLVAPVVKPFFVGYWAATTVAVNASTQLPITTIVYRQKGMALSGGGCKVPISGLYHVGGQARSDNTGSGPNYSQWIIVVNGSVVFQTVRSNNNIASYFTPYQYHFCWILLPLNAGDVVTCNGYSNPLGTTWYTQANWPGMGLRILYDSPLP